MAAYDTKRFYWLQLKEDFFADDAIEWLEDQPNGKEYTLFYLKLCLKSLRANGIMIRHVGDMLVPYDYKKLAEITRTNPDTVLIALKLLTEIGLIKVLENGELYMTQVENMIGSQSVGAFKKQQQRVRAATEQKAIGQKEDICPPDIDIEIDIDIEQEKEKGQKPRVDYQEIINAYNDTCVSLPRASKLSEARKKAIKARINGGYTVEEIKRCFELAERSSFLRGKNDRNWRADFDWLLKDANMAKVLDGKYADKGAASGGVYSTEERANEYREAFEQMRQNENGIFGAW